VLISGSPITIDGEAKGIIGMYVDITERKKSERIKDVISKISEAVHSTDTLDELYGIIHQNISVLMPANNFYIAMCDEFSKMLSFQYWVDETDPKPEPRELKRGITEYVFNTEKKFLKNCKKRAKQKFMALYLCPGWACHLKYRVRQLECWLCRVILRELSIQRTIKRSCHLFLTKSL